MNALQMMTVLRYHSSIDINETDELWMLADLELMAQLQHKELIHFITSKYLLFFNVCFISI